MPKIGIILNERQEIASFMEGVAIAIYQKKDGSWVKTEEIHNYFKERDSMFQMREFLHQLIQELKDCRILVATIITGIPYMILDKEGFFLCEAKNQSEQLLEEISYDYSSMLQEKQKISCMSVSDYPTSPYETKEKGIFELDIRKLQEYHPQISTKKAIIPFLKQKKFYQLKIYCNHIMPWLEHDLSMKAFSYEANKLDKGGYLILIQQVSCMENE